jgi:diguanylate cyclase (GGDEF)-like protein
MFRHLVGSSAIPLAGSAMGGVLMAAGQWRDDSRLMVGNWVALLFVVIAARIWLTAQVRERLERRGFDPLDALRHALTTGLSGIAWGVGGLFVTTAEPMGVALVITGIHALVMGGVVTLSAYVPAFLSYALPACLPMIAVLALGGDTTSEVMAAYSFLFLLLMVGIAFYFNRALRRNWELTFEKEDLIGALTEAHDRLAVLAETDGLTGLANRRRFDEALEREVARLRRGGRSLSLVLLDVDHFKAFNDAHGHVAGDDCLRQVAGVMPAFCHRATDLAARYGGEELAILLPDTPHDGATAVAESVRSRVAGLAIPHRGTGAATVVTVSLGVATVGHGCELTPRDLVRLADAQLYRAKSAGRNCVAGIQG